MVLHAGVSSWFYIGVSRLGFTYGFLVLVLHTGFSSWLYILVSHLGFTPRFCWFDILDTSCIAEEFAVCKSSPADGEIATDIAVEVATKIEAKTPPNSGKEL